MMNGAHTWQHARACQNMIFSRMKFSSYCLLVISMFFFPSEIGGQNLRDATTLFILLVDREGIGISFIFFNYRKISNINFSLLVIYLL